ncbi:hypothetical protein Tco_0931091 [Tanacetum coccineum]
MSYQSLVPLACPQSSHPKFDLAAGADKLSVISYLGPRAIHNLFRGGKKTSSLSYLWLVEGSSKGGDDVGADIGRSGGVPDGGVPNGGASNLVQESMMGGGNGSEWEVDGDSALNRIIAARYPNG